MPRPAIEALLEDNIPYTSIYGADAYTISYENINRYVDKYGIRSYNDLEDAIKSLGYDIEYIANDQCIALTRETP